MENKINVASCQNALEIRTKELIIELTAHLDLIESTSDTGAYTNNKDKRKNFLKSIKSALKNSVTNSSVHGFPNIFKSQRIANQIMWAVFFLSSAILCSWFILNSVQGYLKYDVVSKIKKKH